MSTSLCDLRKVPLVSCFREEEGFEAVGRGGSEAVAEEEGRGGGSSEGAGAGVLVSSSGGGSSEDDPSTGTGGGIYTTVWPSGGSACKSNV